MNIVCPKCSHTRMPGDLVPEWQCPSCGIAYAKFSKKTANLPANNVPESPLLLCDKYIISKSKLQQTSETKGIVLLSKDAIYFARKGGLGSLITAGGILGGAIGGVIAGVAATLIDKTVIAPRMKAAGAVPIDQLPSEIISSLASYGCSGDVVVFPREALKKIEVSIWKGAYLKSENYLFELRLGFFDFTEARKNLAMYQWL